jgi:transposase
MTPTQVTLRDLTPEGRQALEPIAASRTARARLVERARILRAIADGRRPSPVAKDLGLSRPTAYTGIRRFKDRGLHGLEDQPRAGRPPPYTAEPRAEVIAAARTDPKRLDWPFGRWTPDRLRADLNEPRGIPIRRSRSGEILVDEGLRWRHQETGFGERVDPDFAEKRGIIERLDTAPPEGSVVVGLDEMGPESARSFPGQQLVRAEPGTGAEGSDRPAERAEPEIDSGRRGQGEIFGAFRPATGEALAHPDPSRGAVNWADFPGRVEAWIPAEVERVSAIVDHLNAHRAVDILLFAPTFARWEFVFQPKDAASPDLIEPWWKVLRSSALKGRRLETGEEVCRAVEEATAYWNKHRPPFVRGRRRRHRPRRRPGIASVPGVRRLAG